jgi:hypothetical protein
MGSDAMIDIPGFIRTGSGHQILMWDDTQTERRSHKPTLEKYANKITKWERYRFLKKNTINDD